MESGELERDDFMRFVGLDPSTKTGFVAIDEGGIVLKEKELKGAGREEAIKMVTLIDEVIAHIRPEDIICIEGFGFGSQQGFQLGGIGWGIRMALTRRNLKWYEVAPNALKKYVAVTGWVGEEGNKVRIKKEKEKKDLVKNAVIQHFGYRHSSDNVVDAYVLSEIARAIHKGKTDFSLMPSYQVEVIDQILNPKVKAKKKKKVAKS